MTAVKYTVDIRYFFKIKIQIKDILSEIIRISQFKVKPLLQWP